MIIDQLKKLAAEKAVENIQSGMIVGLGTGSTVQFALEAISEKLKNGELKNIRCVPSSMRTESEAQRLGIPLITIEEAVETVVRRSSPIATIDLTIDGADECDAKLNLIKGGGGALLREKILAQNSRRLIIIVDESKLSEDLGEKWAVPVEVVQFAAAVEEEFLKSLGAEVYRRKNSDGNDYVTDENNFILDSNFGRINDPAELSIILDKRAGIVEHGLFIGLADSVFCAMGNGQIKIIS